MSPVPERMADHWWWRPGVRPGRRVLVWHVLPGDQPAVHALVADYHARLAGVAGLDPVPPRWLHMTVQVVGFADEVTAAETARMIAAVSAALRPLSPVTAEIGGQLFHTEAVVLGIRPSGALGPMRARVRDAVAGTVGSLPPEPPGPWTPHLATAYSDRDAPAGPVYRAVTPSPAPTELTVRAVHLVAQERVDHLYRWEPIATAALAG